MANRFKLILVFISFLLIVPSFALAKTSVMKVDWTSTLKSGHIAAKKKLNFATPLISSGYVYVGNSGGYLYRLDFMTGKKLWVKKLKGPVYSTPVISERVLYVGDAKGNVYSIDSSTGEINWNVFIGEEVMTSPAIGDELLYVVTQNNSVFAIDKAAGSIRWTERRSMPFATLTIKGHASPVLIDNKLYVGDTDGVLVVYSALTGKKLSTIPLAAGRGQFADLDSTPL